MDKYQSEAIFYIPGLFMQKNYSLTVKILSLYKYNNEFFNKNTKIGAVYDAPIGAIWNGGRTANTNTGNEAVSLSTIKETINNRFNIPIRLTFTNSQLEDYHLKNEFCNILLDFFSNGKNEIITANDFLKQYIEKNYPNKYKFILSTTACLLNKDIIEANSKNYYLSVLDFRLNKKIEFLKSLKQKDKYEILINEICSPTCGFRKKCYEQISKINIIGNSQYTTKNFNYLENITGIHECKNPIPHTFTAVKENPQFISNNEINKYLQLGFNNFKINGRGFPLVSLAEMLIYYLIKDEYQLEVLEYLLSD